MHSFVYDSTHVSYERRSKLKRFFSPRVNRLRAVPLQSVVYKLGRTGESELAERETSLRSIFSLAWPSWGIACSLPSQLLYRKRERRKCIFSLKILVFIQSSPSPWSPESGYICAGRNGMITTRVSMKTFTGLKPLLFILTTALVDRSRHIKTRPTICRSVHWRVSLVLLSKTRLTIWLSWCWYRSPLPANERVFRKALQKKSSFENHLRVFDDFTSHLRSVFWRSLVK